MDQAQALRTLAAGRERSGGRLDTLLMEERSTRTGSRCTTVAVTSGKGGVGKTNISINLALMLAKMGKKVVLFDADLGLANVNILLGINPAFTLLDVVENRASIHDVVVEGPGGIYIVPAGSGIEKMANLDSVAMGKLMHALEILEQSCDYLVFDTGAGISRTVRSFVNAASRQIVVVTPEPSSLADAYAAVKMIASTGCTNIGVVANMVGSEKEGHETFERLALLTRRFLNRTPEFLGSLPYDRNVSHSVIKQSPIVINNPGSAFPRALSAVALRVLGRSVVQTGDGFFKRFIGFFKQVD